MAVKETPLQKAFRLFDEYNTPQTSDARQDRIVKQLYNLGYLIRPIQTLIIKSPVEYEHLNPGSNKWGLVDRETRRPVIREEQREQAME